MEGGSSKPQTGTPTGENMRTIPTNETPGAPPPPATDDHEQQEEENQRDENTPAPVDREFIERELENNRFSESFDSKRALNSSQQKSASKNRKGERSAPARDPLPDQHDAESRGDDIEYQTLSSTSMRVFLLLFCILIPCIGIPIALLQDRDQKWRLTRDGMLHHWSRSRVLHWCSDWQPDPSTPPARIRLTEAFALDDFAHLILAQEGGAQVRIPLPAETAPVILDRWNTWRGITPGL